MPLSIRNGETASWTINKIVVVGAGIVGMPMAALLARARICQGTERPAPVVVVQRDSQTSGWKVSAINEGRSPIGGVEPGLGQIVSESVSAGLLRASHDYSEARDADVVVTAVQTDRSGLAPDYRPLMAALKSLATVLRDRPRENVPLIVIESTLAPSTMATVISEHFERFGLYDGRDILLGNSPNRVMPGRLIERVVNTDKVVAGLKPLTARLIRQLYAGIVTEGTLLETDSMTAEVVKTLENTYRDVRIAFAAEIARYCDERDLDFHAVRDEVNRHLTQIDTASTDPGAVPIGAVLIPTVGVGGHCLPKDGILLLWRMLENGADATRSLILESRLINDESPAETVRLAERAFGDLTGQVVAVLGAAYRSDSDDTRNSPALVLARLLLEKGNQVTIHDPYVRPDDQNLRRLGLDRHFTADLQRALTAAKVAFVGTGHRIYGADPNRIVRAAPRLQGLLDCANLFRPEHFTGAAFRYAGIGRGAGKPPAELVDSVVGWFHALERGFANELAELVTFLNHRYGDGAFNSVDLEEVRRIAGTCVTGCAVAAPGSLERVVPLGGFMPRLVRKAADC